MSFANFEVVFDIWRNEFPQSYTSWFFLTLYFMNCFSVWKWLTRNLKNYWQGLIQVKNGSGYRRCLKNPVASLLGKTKTICLDLIWTEVKDYICGVCIFHFLPFLTLEVKLYVCYWSETLRAMKTFHFHKLKYFNLSGVARTHFQELLMIFCICNIQWI